MRSRLLTAAGSLLGAFVLSTAFAVSAFAQQATIRGTVTAAADGFGAKTLIDLDVSYEITNGVRLTVGANNIFNTFPDQHELDANRLSGRFPYSRRVTQFGMNGGFYYGRLQLTL